MKVSSLLAVGMYLTCSASLSAEEAGASRIDAQRPPISTSQAEFFEAKVRPILVEHCFKCHGPRKQEAGLRLDSREGILRGTDAGPVVVPGHPEASPLIKAIGHDAAIKMPPRSKLPLQAIDEFDEDGCRWVSPGPRAPIVRSGTSCNGRHCRRCKTTLGISACCGSSCLPMSKLGAWPRTSVDRFILARLERRGLSPSPQADAQTLIRRATFDLLGLPPTPEEVDLFEADATPGAFERLIDRLLASPRYGERWGRYWLDVARYADTKGYILFQDANFHWAYTYRDYVIGAFNQDLPYDRFLIEQIAADRLHPRTARKPLTALGFSHFGRPVHGQCP